MPHCYSFSGRALCAAVLLAPAGAALAQAPVITSVVPMANARAAARTSPLTVGFSQPLTAASAGALKVFSSQRGGLRTRGTTPAVVSGSTLSFAPTYPYMPGETVQYTVTTAATGSGGVLAQSRVGQFTAAAAGTGQGNFQHAPDVREANVRSMAVGDVDGDGNPDLVITNGSTAAMHLNNGNGTFASSQNISVGNYPSGVTLADVDGDGDLDLLTANAGLSSTVSIRFNNGNGAFSGSQNVSVLPVAIAVVTGDIDGDGDLDLLVINNTSPGTVSVRLNNGAGVFSGSQYVSLMNSGPTDLVVGDVDGDGDLDLLTADFGGASTVHLCLNDGNGTFTNAPRISVGLNPTDLVLGDVDADGDLDLLVVASSAVSVRLNNGSGTFSGSQNIGTGPYSSSVALGDMDGDSDLDLIIANNSNDGDVAGTVSIRLNNGSGFFSGNQEVPVGSVCTQVKVADIDGDGDLDILASNFFGSLGGTISVRLNGTALATAAGHATPTLSLAPNPAHGAATLTGAAPHAPLTMLDALGRVCLTATTDATGTARLALPAGLPTGVYLVRCGPQVRRLAVE